MEVGVVIVAGVVAVVETVEGQKVRPHQPATRGIFSLSLK